MPDPISKARSLMGAKYKWGGNCPDGVDCSGLTKYVYPNLPRTAREQKQAAQAVDTPGPGDLAFLRGTQPKRLPADAASHVGIVTDRGTIIHASSAKGKVVEVPLSEFTKSRNFYGFGRLNGNTPPMRKSAPTVAPPRANLYGAMADAFGPDGRVDPARFLQHFGQDSAGGNLPLFDPFSPTVAETPAYNPRPTIQADDLRVLLGLVQAGPAPDPAIPVRPYDERRTLTVPSLASQRDEAEQGALAGPTDSEREVARLKAQANLLKAQAEVLKNNPVPQREIPEDVPLPQRQFAERPDRPAPRLDPTSGILAALAGLVDPSAAGAYASVPLSAGVQAADREYADRMTAYKDAVDRLSQEYEDALFARNEKIRRGREVSDTNFANAAARREGALAEGNLGAQAGFNDALIKDTESFIPREKSALESSLKGAQLNRTITEQLQQNQQRLSAEKQALSMDAQAARNAFGFLSNLYNAQSRADIAQDTNQTRKDIATSNNASRERAAQTRANATIQAAQVRAQAAQARVNSKDISKLPPGYREKVSAAFRNHANAEQAYNRAIRDASKQYAEEHKYTEAGKKPDLDAYINERVQPFKLRADQFRQQADAIWEEAKSVAGVPAPANGSKGNKGNNTPSAAPSLSGFSNLRIRQK